jgi:hypothetical protein
MQTATDCYVALRQEATPAASQRILNQFVDDFRRSSVAERRSAVAEPVCAEDSTSAILAATIETLCAELDMMPPVWIRGLISPKPHFAFGAKSFELRVRLMIDSPPAFKSRRVFVPDTFLKRA